MADNKITELKSELEINKSELQMYYRWFFEKNNFGYWKEISFEQIKEEIESTKRRIEAIELKIENLQ